MEKSIKKEIKDITKDVGKIVERSGAIIEKQINSNKGRHKKHKLIIGFTATFGIAAVIYGFQGVLDGIDFFRNNPSVVFVIGVAALFKTGMEHKNTKVMVASNL